MKAVVIYARYSSDLQKDSSIEDQIRVCRQMLREDERLVDICTDKALSGSHLGSRPGITRLIAMMESGDCSVIIAEGLDRLSRDMCDMAHIHRLAGFHNVEIRTLIDGPVDRLTLGFRGAMNGMQLDDLKQRTRRGQAGRILAGRAGGGRAYGYRMRYLNDEGLPERGLREIDPVQAEVVRSIYEDYVAGMPVTHIVRRLNETGIPGPRGGKWSSVTLTGHHDRGDGILQNAIYRGLLVWGRMTERRHPVTNRRQMTPVKSDGWVTQAVPELRIVEDDLWLAAQERRRASRRLPSRRRPFRAFGLRCICAGCGAVMTRSEHKYLICATHKRHQACANTGRVRIERLLARLREMLNGAEGERLWRSWKRQLAAKLDKAGGELAERHRRVEALIAENGRLVDALATGLAASETVRKRLLANEAEIDRLRKRITEDRALPPVSALDRRTFRTALNRALKADEMPGFLNLVLASVTLQQGARAPLAVTAIEPDFAAIAALAEQPADGSGDGQT